MYNEDYLQHHGIKGMKWGVRRWQNDDGSLTPAGEKRYLKYQGLLERRPEEELSFKERILKNIENASERGYNIGYAINYHTDKLAIAGTVLGSIAGTITTVPLAVLQRSYDKHKYKQAEKYIEKYKNTLVKDL